MKKEVLHGKALEEDREVWRKMCRKGISHFWKYTLSVIMMDEKENNIGKDIT